MRLRLPDLSAFWQPKLIPETRQYLMRLALYQPDIPQNTGTILRLAACLAVPVDVIGPTGFDMTDRSLRRSGLDYLDHVELVRHVDFAAFEASRQAAGRRLVLLTTKGGSTHVDMVFLPNDVLLLGRESAGVPDAVHHAADERVRIPLAPGLRSLNIAMAAALVVGEALRQTGGFPDRLTVTPRRR
jgi:tRNA (cytidine/uridine-2'-O-)-methyltransferase